MALEELNEMLSKPRNMKERTYERKLGKKLTGIVELRWKLIPVEEGVFVKYIETTYIVPEFTSAQESEFNKLCGEIDCYYKAEEVKDEKLRKQGLTKKILVPLPPIPESKGMSKINEFFEFPDYENIS